MDPRYPIGKYSPAEFSEIEKQKRIKIIEFLPNDVELAVQNFDTSQYETAYRDGGWTVKQLIHHIADSHMNAYIRFKLGLTENNPTIKPYNEASWANLEDTNSTEINVSLTLLHALHKRWVNLLYSIANEDLISKSVIHPDHNKQMTLWFLLGMYAWHSQHHLAHITTLKENKGWK